MDAYKTTVQVLVHREDVFTVPLYLQAISKCYFTIILHKSLYHVCLDLWGFGQGVNLTS